MYDVYVHTTSECFQFQTVAFLNFAVFGLYERCCAPQAMPKHIIYVG